MVAGRLDPPRAWPTVAELGVRGRPATPALLAAVAGDAARYPRCQVAGQGVDAHRAVLVPTVHGPGRGRGPWARQAAEDLKAAGKIVGELVLRGR